MPANRLRRRSRIFEKNSPKGSEPGSFSVCVYRIPVDYRKFADHSAAMLDEIAWLFNLRGAEYVFFDEIKSPG
jgi:hypothetical protein